MGVKLSNNPLSPSPSPNPPHSPLRGGKTKDASLFLHGRGEKEAPIIGEKKPYNWRNKPL